MEQHESKLSELRINMAAYFDCHGNPLRVASHRSLSTLIDDDVHDHIEERQRSSTISPLVPHMCEKHKYICGFAAGSTISIDIELSADQILLSEL